MVSRRSMALGSVVTVVLAITVVLALATSLATQALAKGSGFAFLTLPAGARAASLGGAFTAVADDGTALFWNPAGIAEDRPPGERSGLVAADHNESFQSFRQDLVGGIYRRGGDGISLALNTHYTEAIEERDELGNLLGSFGATDLAFALGYARTLSNGLRLGGSVQWTHEALGGTPASAFSVSAGGLLAVPAVPGLTLGAAVRNLGSRPSFEDGESFDQPLTVAAGASYEVAPGGLRWLATGEVWKLRDFDPEVRFGLETRPLANLALRGGWMFGQDAADLTAGAGFTSGRWGLDYAFVPYANDLGTSHRVALSARL